ncbi:diaminopimelate decarboxylase [Roseivirga sp. UBA1976]|uniref:diaminopimelate decarboxylase n=1 Tax=Roseivirga sp. UBA1976 TaxID=1947386 RepID=UPI00257DB0B8|nr:diaminopimelate decarboxylase [Roseivirga sp. UBA1976]MEC7754476.1 diaminopimelate decarboxylase [Bacteroidota bacterium]|tara:strand:+ start:11137 stop:12369 length:1233 start_codon:yes stop_codon:yes gene_type:complete
MELVNGRYNIQGIDLESLAEEFGTPVYVYDAAKIKSQFDRLSEAFPQVDLRIKYACKSLTNISILKLLKSYGSELDCVSVQEVKLGLKAGFSPEQILYTPNCVSFEEIQQAVELGVMINLDNISLLEQFGNKYHNTVPVCIRLNPHIMAGGNKKISTGHADSKFGISIYQIAHILKVVSTYNIDVVGLHMHTGSDILDAEVFLRGAEILFDAAKNFDALRFIDFGSGFKVAYKEGDITTDIEEVGAKLSSAFVQFCETYGKKLEMWFEPGKFLVSEAGVFLVRTNVVKTTPATVFAGVDSGLNHLIRPMMYDAYHEIVNISNTSGTKRVYTVVGYICETDTFGLDRKLSEVKEGDILAFKNAGAYGFSMASNYNSRLRPAEVLVYNGKAHLIRQRETFDDILRNQVEIDI